MMESNTIHLTYGEGVVLDLARQGLRTQDMAAKLEVGEAAIKAHLANAYRKIKRVTGDPTMDRKRVFKALDRLSVVVGDRRVKPDA